ncbi:MAG: DAK2 domain-containing protein [Chloroflexota bacterium]
MARRSCDGDGLLAAFRAAVANLEAHVDEVNALNVYPVPDGDTGSNMLATVRAALDEGEGAAGGPADRIAAAISFGALMGARGNSGVITSQIFRGMADGLGGKRRFNGLDLAHAMSQGARMAYLAVAKPVEGTILTVIREVAAAAVTEAERDDHLETVLTVAVDAAERSVARTPSLLKILRDAGVVDSGGQGLFRLFEGALHQLTGEGTARPVEGAIQTPGAAALIAAADDGFGYETMFLLEPNGAGLLDIDAIRDHLESIGESVLVAGDSRTAKVHIHNEHPDAVLGYALSLGTLSKISVENLDRQTHEIRERRATAFAGDGRSATTPQTIVAATPATPEPGSDATLALPIAVVAVASGEGLAAIFRDFGAAAIVRGGQSANPSTGELLDAIGGVDAREVLILPNNPNVILAARQVASMADRPVAVVPTRNAAEGFAALLALDPAVDAASNVAALTRAAREVQTFSVTEAVRDATIGGREVKRGQTIALDPDDGLVAAGKDRLKTILEAIRAFEPGFELVTIYYGDGADLVEAELLSKRIGEAAPGIEVEVRHGGQPHYRYLVSAE